MRTKRTHAKTSRLAFTLVELLVVIAIIGILIALLLPAVQAARESARRSQCTNNVKQLGVALQNYHDIHKKFAGCYAGSTGNVNLSTGRNWMFAILPFIEQGNLQALTSYTLPMGSGAVGSATYTINTQVSLTVVPAFLCPSDQNEGGIMGTRSDSAGTRAVTNYKGSCGSNWAWGDPICQYTFPKGGYFAPSNNGLDATNGIFMRNWNNDPKGWVPMSDVQDGLSNTFLVGEAVPRWSQWNWWWWSNGSTATTGIPLNYSSVAITTSGGTKTLESQWGDWPNNYSFFSRHAGSGANFVFADGHTSFISDNIDLNTYRYLGNRGDQVTANVNP